MSNLRLAVKQSALFALQQEFRSAALVLGAMAQAVLETGASEALVQAALDSAAPARVA
ncbi:MAG: hypothetical protein IT366_03710 [Candidatus Hydrogenedentes bacterium]|nr:hypothetical protein [Candidatus Hydrogenedentota bacterium]